MQSIFIAIANFWHTLFGWLQDPAAGLWNDLLGVRVIGPVLSFFETFFGRGATL
ncbi:MAG: hypothetical protein FWF60_03565 [Oscillospiraceae bacterium]|nr:hypothetical protein [Oscillospiraceae bacterium]